MTMEEAIERLTFVKGGFCIVYVVEERIVPLVRCEECKRWSYSSLIDNHNRCERTLKLTKADDFCSYGERSEE